ncbi:MAG: hypothetical protein JEZ00_17335 [Anaerolineaceae bacterium]|nr:hypothetical protein [Anaerolineaceae bacterium]
MIMNLSDNTRVWRYMSFSKLVWMLQNKRLWLSNANMLGDKWELMPLGQQLNSHIINRPPTQSAEDATFELAEKVKLLRKNTYINCWTASEHESHALWKIFCPSSEGVAIQTTLGRLKQSIGLPIVPVSYGSHDALESSPDPINLLMQKRPMFEYEQEVRIILVQDYSDSRHSNRQTIGVEVDWDPEIHLEMIWVHPEAGFWFMEAVSKLVSMMAPKLSHESTPLVAWSKMNSGLPF